MLRLIHTKQIIKLVKEYFNTNVVFQVGPRPFHDFENDFLLEAHQETKQFARDFYFGLHYGIQTKRMGVNGL